MVNLAQDFLNINFFAVFELCQSKESQKKISYQQNDDKVSPSYFHTLYYT